MVEWIKNNDQTLLGGGKPRVWRESADKMTLADADEMNNSNYSDFIFKFHPTGNTVDCRGCKYSETVKI